jgi:predicted nucleic acid-binding protein
MIPHKLVLDAGPLISLFRSKDGQHQLCAQTFQQFAKAQTRLLTPAPIVFEVYKRLLYDDSRKIAITALRAMLDSLEIMLLGDLDFLEIEQIVNRIEGWNGSLEDATLALVATQRGAPTWTFNYRDLAAFPNLEFWTPGTQ